MFFVEKSFFGTEKRYLCPFISGKGIFLEGGIGMRVRYLSLVFNGGMQGMVIQKVMIYIHSMFSGVRDNSLSVYF